MFFIESGIDKAVSAYPILYCIGYADSVLTRQLVLYISIQKEVPFNPFPGSISGKWTPRCNSQVDPQDHWAFHFGNWTVLLLSFSLSPCRPNHVLFLDHKLHIYSVWFLVPNKLCACSHTAQPRVIIPPQSLALPLNAYLTGNLANPDPLTSIYLLDWCARKDWEMAGEK